MATAARAVSKPSKQEKLKELAARRVPSAIEKIRLVGNLTTYKPTTQDVDKIMEALRAACKKTEDRLRANIADTELFEL